MVVSCADPGIFARGEGGPKKTLITFIRHQLFYSFKKGYQWFILRKLYFLRFQRGSNNLQGRGSKFFPGRGGGGKCLYRTCEFLGGGGSGPLDPRMRMIDPPIPKDRFSHAMAYFLLLERLVTLQNMIRYMIVDILSGSTLYFI